MITLNLPEAAIKGLDEAVDQGIAADRSRAIRQAVRDYLKLHKIWPRIVSLKDGKTK